MAMLSYNFVKYTYLELQYRLFLWQILCRLYFQCLSSTYPLNQAQEQIDLTIQCEDGELQVQTN